MGHAKQWVALATATLSLLCPRAVAAPQEQAEDEAAYRRCAAELVFGLEDLARYCSSQRLYLERDRLYERILELDPEHADARRFLKYRKVNGRWVQKGYRPPKSRNPDALDEYGRRYGCLLAACKAKLRARLEASGGEFDEESLLAYVLRLDPDDPRARTGRGEVWDEARERWVLAETRTARALREELEARMRERRSVDAECSPDELPGRAVAVDLSWTDSRKGPSVRICGTQAGEEIARAVGIVESTLHLFRAVTGAEDVSRSGFTVFLLRNRQEAGRFVEQIPDPVPSHSVEASIFSSFWIGYREVVVAEDQGEHVSAHLVRQTVDFALRDGWRISCAAGWILDGMSLYSSTMLADRGDGETRPLKTGKRTRSSGERPGGGPGKESDPWRCAAELLRSERCPDLEVVLARSAAEMTEEDRLVAYALCRYLIEGRPDDVRSLLEMLGQGISSGRAVQLVLEMDLAQLDARLRRWIREMEAADGHHSPSSSFPPVR